MRSAAVAQRCVTLLRMSNPKNEPWVACRPAIIIDTFEDESADSGDQLNTPMDLGKQMSFHCAGAFISEPITALLSFFPPLLPPTHRVSNDAESSHR